MRSFFAMLWDQADPVSTEISAAITKAPELATPAPARRVSGPGVFIADLETSAPDAGSLLPIFDSCGTCVGALYGTIFDRRSNAPSPKRLTCVPARLQARIIASGGACLPLDIWGSYICVLTSSDRAAVIAEPAGSIPCYHAERSGVRFVFSHLENCPFLDRRWFSLDLEYIRRMLAYDKIQNGGTALKEVRELMGGERLSVSKGGARTDQIWDPRVFARDRFAPAPDIAEQDLREVALATVGAWASCYSRVLVDLSGGFDSSSVLGMLSRLAERPEIIPVHHRTDSLDPPESRYAAAAARHAGIALREVVISPDRRLPDLLSHPLSTRPYRQFVGFDLTPDMERAGITVADATFTGQGGDHLFLATSSPLGFADYLIGHGLSRRAGSQLMAAAKLSDVSVWNVLAECLPHLVSGGSQSPLIKALENRQSRYNTDPEILQGLAASIPEWARDAQGLPPAKFNQVSNLMHMFHFREPMERKWSRHTIHPLISQPLIELCLRLPAYLLTSGGESRGLARRAFSQFIPDVIRRRMIKGDASRQFARYIDANRHEIARALSEGELVREGFLSREAVQEFIRRDEFRSDRFGRMILVAYAIEAWLSSWKREWARHSASINGVSIFR